MLSDMTLLKKEDMTPAADNLSDLDIKELAMLLNEKDDKIRYAALQLLQSRSQSFGDVYPYFDIFVQKLKSDNSYQRSIGLMLMAENAKWDTDLKFDDALDDYLCGVGDEKPITARQCIQALEKVVPYKPTLLNRIASQLMKVDMDAQRPTMKKLILLDILHILLQIRKLQPSDDIDAYIFDALSGGILDDKSKKQIKKEI